MPDTTERKMKDSGIEWIGQIPEDWEVQRIKNCYSIISGNGFPVNIQGQEHGDYPVCKASDISVNNGGFIMVSANYITKAQATAFNIIPVGSIVFAKIGEALKKNNRAIMRVPGCLDNNCQALVPKEMQEKYSLYLLSCIDMTWFDNAGTVPCISNIKLGKCGIPCPPVKEQYNIASFLDAKCAEIDSLRADIEKEIETLEEYKKSVITEAVTKGLDPNVPMKDSGIEWIGKIPASWEIHPVYVYFGERKNKNHDLREKNLLSLSYGKIIRKDIDTVGGLLPASFNTYNIVEAGDIIIRPTDLQNDKRSLRTGLVNERGIITSAYIDLAPKMALNSSYYHYLLHSYDVQKVFYNMGNGVRQGLNYPEFSKLMVFAPSLDEQNAIVAYLDDKCSQIEIVIDEKERQLAYLDDYKKSVIYEYVTGKKEVPSI